MAGSPAGQKEKSGLRCRPIGCWTWMVGCPHRSPMRTLTVSLMAMITMLPTLPLLAAEPAEEASSKWEKDIRAFEAADAKEPPEKGGTLFVGSSSIRMWKTLEEDFPDRRTINRGFGGSQMSDLLAFMDRIVLPYEPSVILVYEGDNDLANGKSPGTVLYQFKDFVRRVHAELPETHVVFIAVKPSVARKHLLEQVRETNRLIEDFAGRADRVSFIDVATPMLNPEGEPKAGLFTDDMLHLNADGYALWTSIVRSHLNRLE